MVEKQKKWFVRLRDELTVKNFCVLISVYNTTFILSVTEPGGRRGVKLSLLK